MYQQSTNHELLNLWVDYNSGEIELTIQELAELEAELERRNLL